MELFPMEQPSSMFWGQEDTVNLVSLGHVSS